MKSLVVISCFMAFAMAQHPAHMNFDVNVEIGKLHDLIAAARQREEPVQHLQNEPEPLPLDTMPEAAPVVVTSAPAPVQNLPVRRRPGLRRRRPQGAAQPILRRRPEFVQQEASPASQDIAPVVQEVVSQPIAPEPRFRAQSSDSENIQTIDYHPTFRQQVTFADEQQQHRFAPTIAEAAPEPLPVGPGMTHDENGLLINPRGYDGPLAHTVPAGLGGTIHTQFTPEVAAFHKFLAQAHADHLAQVAGLERQQF